MLVAQPLSPSSSSCSEGELLFTSKSMAESSSSLDMANSTSPTNTLVRSVDLLFCLVLKSGRRVRSLDPELHSSSLMSNTDEACVKLILKLCNFSIMLPLSAKMVT